MVRSGIVRVFIYPVPCGTFVSARCIFNWSGPVQFFGGSVHTIRCSFPLQHYEYSTPIPVLYQNTNRTRPQTGSAPDALVRSGTVHNIWRGPVYSPVRSVVFCPSQSGLYFVCGTGPVRWSKSGPVYLYYMPPPKIILCCPFFRLCRSHTGHYTSCRSSFEVSGGTAFNATPTQHRARYGRRFFKSNKLCSYVLFCVWFAAASESCVCLIVCDVESDPSVAKGPECLK